MLEILLFSLLQVSEFTTGSETTCTDGWLGYRGSCYLFGQGAVHFTEAEQYCRQHSNSHLIHVNDKAENDFIKDRLRELIAKPWWLGMRDEMVEGSWKWFDTDEPVNFTDWQPGDYMHDDEDCAIFWNPYNFRWADAYCTMLSYPLCEKSGRVCETEVIG